MTEIMVAKRDGVATAPDGVKYRTHRGKTLADARHPLVQAYPQDWSPMEIALTVDGPVAEGGATLDKTLEDLLDARNDLAEVEEVAEARGLELVRLAGSLEARGIKLPAAEDRAPGWLADLVLDALDALAGGRPAAPAPVAPPRAPRSARRAVSGGE